MRASKTDFVPSPLGHFLEALATDGHVTVSPYNDQPVIADENCASLLTEWDSVIREQLSEDAPVFDLAAATWAAVLFYRAAQFLVCREVPAETVRQTLRVSCAWRRGPSTDYSVDLVFRFMPALFHLAIRLAPDDELIPSLKKLAHEWPLSSVGVVLTEKFSIAHFAHSVALRRLYADRITLHHAIDRLPEPTMRTLLRADLGFYPELDPGLAHALENDRSA